MYRYKMTERVIPIIITTPRTGSYVFTNQIYNVYKHFNIVKSNLLEYFTIIKHYESHYAYIDNVLAKVSHVARSSKWFDNARDIKLQRLDVLKNDPNYLIKLFLGQCEPEVVDFVSAYYKPIYLERNNKVAQILSACSINSNPAHYNNSNTIAEKFMYDRTMVDYILRELEKYYQFKSSNESITFYYEELLKVNFSQDYICYKLDLPIIDVRYNIETVATPYSGNNIEDNIINIEEWNRDKEWLISELSKYGDSNPS